jgi:hypothetical protein
MLRKRINSIKTVYRTDLMKGIKSKKSAASPNEVYKQKLSWYMKADAFLNDATASRRLHVAWCVKIKNISRTDFQNCHIIMHG